MNDWSTFGSEVKSHIIARGPTCAIRLMLDDLPDDARDAVAEVFGNRGITNSAIDRALRARLGEDAPTVWSIKNHRGGRCRCAS